ncbi:MAG: DNA/RNA non-specific endonuclease [Treponema sp.]|nr:DNA/RNA non-specific endonuclease [Treponema sp.]
MNSKNTLRIIVLVVIAAVGFLSKGKINVSSLANLVGADVHSSEEAIQALGQEAQNTFHVSQSENTVQTTEDSIAPQETAQSETTAAQEAASPAQAEESAQNAAKQNGYIALSGIEIPVCAAKDHAKDHEIRAFKNYKICYRETYEQPEWAAYLLTKEMLTKNSQRTNDFRPDPKISTGSATLADYRGSGYSRGHLAPAADFAYDSQAISETFYMSNMSPQTTDFNGGIWQELESQVRYWAKRFSRVYVISGPVLEKKASEYKSIGANKVSVPEYYYKAILAPVYKNASDRSSPEDSKSVMVIGFIMPNELREDSIWNYAVSIDEIENRTGLDFFSILDDELEEKLENTVKTTPWQ